MRRKTAFLVIAMIVFFVMSVSSGQSEDVIKIGGFAPLTGPYVNIGKNIRDGIQLAVDLQNETGGIKLGDKAYKIKVIWGDTESKVEAGLSVIDKLCTVDKIDVAAGFLHSHIFVAGMDKLQAYQIPTTDAVAASLKIPEKISSKKLDYIFMVSPTTKDICRAPSEAVNHYMKPNKIAILNENTDAGRDYSRLTKDWFKKNAPDVKIVYDELVNQNTTDFTAEFAKIKASGATVCIGEIYGASASVFVEQWYEMKMPSMFVTFGSTVLSEDFLKNNCKEMERNLSNNRWWPGDYTKISIDRIDEYKKRFGKDPTNFSIQGHDSAFIMLQAIEKAGSLDKEKIKKALSDGHFLGIWGDRKFSSLSDGHTSPTDMVVVQVQNCQKVPLWPLKVKKGDYKTVPPWPWELK